VDTIPPATMDSFRHHGTVTPDAIEQDVESARAVLTELELLGVSLNEVTEKLVKDGVQKFADAFDKLFDSIAHRRDMLLERKHSHQVIKPDSPEIGTAVDG
jgi:transaldolase/glucose-6-phosphate isomerase